MGNTSTLAGRQTGRSRHAPDSAYAARGRELSRRFEALLEPALAAAPRAMRAGIADNAADRAYLSGPGSRSGDRRFFFRMNERRLVVLAKAEENFLSLARELGWREGGAAAADLILPLWDVAERLCFCYYGHQHRTMEYAGMLLDRRGIYGEERAVLLMGALLHDVGKAAVPARILRIRGRKPDEDESRAIRMHPRYGRRIILSAAARLSARGFRTAHAEDIADIAFSHQEMFNGKGYPARGAGTDIPIGGRIAAFCDAFDTMTSVRIYEPNPRNYDAARKEAFDQLDRHFNKSIVGDFFGAALDDAVRSEIFALIRSAGGSP